MNKRKKLWLTAFTAMSMGMLILAPKGEAFAAEDATPSDADIIYENIAAEPENGNNLTENDMTGNDDTEVIEDTGVNTGDISILDPEAVVYEEAEDLENIAEPGKTYTTVLDGKDYSAVYDYYYYLNKYPDLKTAFENNEAGALRHFVNFGMTEGRQASADFDLNSYKKANLDLRNAFGIDNAKYYMHYINSGKREGRAAVNVTERVGSVTAYEGVDYKPVYNFNYYRSKYPDMKTVFGDDDILTIRHFVLFGMKEGRQGKVTFDVQSYAYANADLRKAYKNDYTKYYNHYIKFGYAEGRTSRDVTEMQNAAVVKDKVDYSAVYDYNYYTKKYPTVKDKYGLDDEKVLDDFVNEGIKLGKQGSEDFEVESYIFAHADIRHIYKNAVEKYYYHFINFGKKEGRVATGVDEMKNYATVYDGIDYAPVYDFNYYAERYPDTAEKYGYDDEGLLDYFVNKGIYALDRASENFDPYSYAFANPELRAYYKNNLYKYYLHYIKIGSKKGYTAKDVGHVVDEVKVYDGVNYKDVYDYIYYVSKYPQVWRQFYFDDAGVLEYFVTTGVKKYHQAYDRFDILSYAYAHADLRRAYKNDILKYVTHYINYGKAEGRIATGVTDMKNCTTVINDVDYKDVYDYSYYTKKYADVKQAYGFDDQAVLLHFVTFGMKEGRRGCKEFDVYSYAYANVDLRRAYKDNIASYYTHYMRDGKREGRKAWGYSYMRNFETKYKDIDYAAVYDFNYYWKNNAQARKVTTFDDLALLEYFAKVDVYTETYAIEWDGTLKDYMATKNFLAASTTTALREAVVEYAMQFLGKPYVHGGHGPDVFDCSGFTYYVYKHFGIYASPSSDEQQTQGVEIIGIENALPGDIICRGTYDQDRAGHVGLYIGNGKMIHAADESTGVVIGDAIVASRKLFTIRRLIY
ncbi:MAG: C40 family peptidase [Eubacterium sp.]|nr:C40 family peptidase [Eubacterium sp.]